MGCRCTHLQQHTAFFSVLSYSDLVLIEGKGMANISHG